MTNPFIQEGANAIAPTGASPGSELTGLVASGPPPGVGMGSLRNLNDVRRAYVIADNQLALKAGWDEDLLAEELEALMGLDPGFDLTVTGFSIPEIDGLIADHKPEKPGNLNDDLLPDPAQVRRWCKRGDIYQLGPHRLICGDARERSIVAALMDGQLARMVFTDPPYNVPIQAMWVA